MAGSKGLFACTKCHSRHPFEDLSKDDHLCKVTFLLLVMQLTVLVREELYIIVLKWWLENRGWKFQANFSKKYEIWRKLGPKFSPIWIKNVSDYFQGSDFSKLALKSPNW